MKILSLITLLLYCGLLFPTAVPYVNNKLVELQNNHKLYAFSVQSTSGKSVKYLCDQPDDQPVLLVASLPQLAVVDFKPQQSLVDVNLNNVSRSFSARAPPFANTALI